MFIIRRFRNTPPPPNSDTKNTSDTDSETSSDSDNSLNEAEIDAYITAFRSINSNEPVPDTELDPVANYKETVKTLESESVKKFLDRNARRAVSRPNAFDFPPDNENWCEEDLREFWDNGANTITGTGWDPAFANDEGFEFVKRKIDKGLDTPTAPFYVPYKKTVPPVPDNHPAIKGPKDVIEELDRIEEFLKWVSYVFPDGSTFEGTVWDDIAQGKGVYASRDGFVRYEGEWVRNDPEGHGVIEVEIPDIEPVPGSELEEDMRAEGKIIKRDFMSLEEREWLDKDIEDSYLLANGRFEIPYYENEEWVNEFGELPEKGRYRYAGQLKHGRMHGCGVYEYNERIIYGRFYFGEIVEEDDEDDGVGCDDRTSAMHAGIAEVAAAKARMFVNKPDGMVRERKGPYNDPQHAYLYEEEDVWMAPGFINQFYDVPDYWKTYAHEVDQEREMWLNSFYRAPLRIPMPAELEYWWTKEENHQPPEFVLINKEPEPDPEDPSKLIYTEDPLILHTPTGHIINYVEDEKYGVQMFWQPPLRKGEKADPNKATFLPLGYDEFFGIDKKEKNIWVRLKLAIEKVSKPWFDKVEKWAEEQKKITEMKKNAHEKELELIEAEICLEEAIGDMEELLRRSEREETKKAELGLPDEDDKISAAKQDGKARVDEEEEDDDEDEDDSAPSSFGSIEQEQKTDEKKGKPGKSPFSTSSLGFASSSLISVVPSKLQLSFPFWRKVGSKPGLVPAQCIDHISDVKTVDSVSFPPVIGQKGRLKAVGKTHKKVIARSYLGGKFLEVSSMSQTRPCYVTPVCSKSNSEERKTSGDVWLHAAPERDFDSILSLHPISSMYNFYPNIQREPHFKFKF